MLIVLLLNYFKLQQNCSAKTVHGDTSRAHKKYDFVLSTSLYNSAFKPASARRSKGENFVFHLSFHLKKKAEAVSGTP